MVAFAESSSNRQWSSQSSKPERPLFTRGEKIGITAGVTVFWAVVIGIVATALYRDPSNDVPLVQNPSSITISESPSDAPLVAMSLSPTETTPSSFLASGSERQETSPLLEPEVAVPSGPTQDEAYDDFVHTVDAMGQAVVRRIYVLENTLKQLVNNDATLDQFAAEMFDGRSRLQCVFDSPAHQKWIDRRFRELILDPEDLTKLVDTMLRELNEELLKIRTQQLVRLKLDEELEGEAMSGFSPDDPEIQKLLDSTTENVAFEVTEGTKEFIIRWATSEIAGELASRATLAIAGDSDAAHVLAFLAEMQTSQAVDDAMYRHANPEGRLKLMIVNRLVDLFERIFDLEVENSVGQRFVKLVDFHKQAQLRALEKWLPEGTHIQSHD